MEPDREQFYQRRIAALEKRNAELLKQNAKLAEQEQIVDTRPRRHLNLGASVVSHSDASQTLGEPGLTV